MNAATKAAVALACLSPEQFRAEIAEVSAPTQPGMAAADQIFPTSSDQSDAATPELGVSKDAAQLAAARAEGRSEGLKAGRAERLTEGHAVPGVKPMSAYEEGRASAQALLDITMAPAEMAKYQAGASAARAILNKVAGAPDEMSAYERGAAAARALLGKTATTLEAK
jgi:hypothetical protein